MITRLLSRVVPVVGLALVALAVGCHQTPGSTMQVKTNSAVVASVAQFRTYSHQTASTAPAGYVEGAFTQDALERVRRRVDVEMEKKGYVLVPNGEIVVRISSGVRNVIDEPRGSVALAGAPVQQTQIGSLVIDIFQRENEGQLFHGYARDELHHREATDLQINTAVQKILEPLPARSVSATQ